MHYICPSTFHIGTIYKLPTSSSKRSIDSHSSLLVYSTYIFSLYYSVVSTKKTRLLNLIFLVISNISARLREIRVLGVLHLPPRLFQFQCQLRNLQLAAYRKNPTASGGI